MMRPKSLTFFLFFIMWSVFKAGESLLRTSGTSTMFEYYGFSYLYYVDVAFIALGGLGLAYAVYKAKPWGNMLGYLWLAVGIITLAFTAVVSYVNKPLMTEIMTLTREAQGRPTEGISEFVYSTAYDLSTMGSAVVMIGVMLFFAWKLHQHRIYFTLPTAPANNSQQ